MTEQRMKALSFTQPWATLLAGKAKRIETRSWSTPYRGLIAIHAAKGFPREAMELALTEPFRNAIVAAGYRFLAELPRGAIIAVATLVTCERTEVAAARRGRWEWIYNEREGAFGDFTPGRWAWFLDEARALAEPIPCRGALGVWDVPPEVEARTLEFVSGKGS